MCGKRLYKEGGAVNAHSVSVCSLGRCYAHGASVAMLIQWGYAAMTNCVGCRGKGQRSCRFK